MPRSVTIRAFCAALLMTNATADRLRAAETVEIANPTLSVVLAIPDGRLTVTDRRCDMVWRQHVPVQSARGSDWGKDVRTNKVGANQLLQIERASVREGTIHAAASWSGHPFSIRFELPEEGAELTVAIDTPNPEQRLPWEAGWAGLVLMTYPYAFYNPNVVDTVVPLDEGVVYSPEDVDPSCDPRRWSQTALHSHLSMPWWGVTDGQRGVMTQIETPWDCMFSIDWVETDSGTRTLPQITWLASKHNWGYSRRVTFRFLQQGGHVAMAKAFRSYEQQRGAFRSWQDKLADNPDVARLKGALDVWNWETLTDDVVHALQDAGIRQCVLGKPRGGNSEPGEGVEPEAIQAACEAGYLIGVYHNHSWIQNRWIKQDPSMADAAIIDADGKHKTIANPWDPNGRLDRCPAAHREIFMRHATAERELGINYFFTDCTTTGGSIHECYHPDHPVIRSEGAAALSQALSDVGRLGMLVGSERGKWWATGATHVFEGIETLIQYGGQYYGKGDDTHWVGPYLTEKPGFEELCLGYDFNPARRLPLFQLVYHDSVYCTRRWNQDPGRDASLWDRHDLMNILYGTAPLIFMHPRAGNVIGSGAEAGLRTRYLQTYRNVCGWHEKIGFDEMTDHRILTADRLVQETRFSSGQAVVVNFGSAAWDDPRGFAVPGSSFHQFLVTIGGGEQKETLP